MSVLRIVPNLPVGSMEQAKAFYRDVLGLENAMDHGWIATFTGPAQQQAQVSVATDGGSGTPVPHLSIEVDDVDEVLQRVEAAGAKIVYGPVEEPWGLRWFYVRDPSGWVPNVLQPR